MKFFDLPLEIRFEIYAYLLVKQDYITAGGPRWAMDQGLHPEILLTNKGIHHEASPLLYSHNKFLIWESPEHEFSDPNSRVALVPYFLEQIGAQAPLVRHIAMTLWTFDHGLCRANGTVDLDAVDRENMKAIRTMCPSIRTLKISLVDTVKSHHCLLAWTGPPETDLQLHILAGQLKDIPSLENVALYIHVYVDEDDQEAEQIAADAHSDIGPKGDIRVVGNGNHRRSEIDAMEEVAASYGWAVDVERYKRRTWRTSDGRWIYYSQEDLEFYEDDLLEEEERQEELELERSRIPPA